MTYSYEVGFALQIIKSQNIFSSDFTKKILAIRHFSHGPTQFPVLVSSADHLPGGLPNHLAESHCLSFCLPASSHISPSFPLGMLPIPQPLLLFLSIIVANICLCYPSLASQNCCARIWHPPCHLPLRMVCNAFCYLVGFSREECLFTSETSNLPPVEVPLR